MNWSIITGEYPPSPGGVADYTAQVGRGLALAGDRVTVYAPANPTPLAEPGFHVVALPGHFGLPSIRQLNRALRSDSSSRILLQYVPHAFGLKAMNLPLCVWLRSIPRERVSIMFHEVVYPWKPHQRPAERMLAIVTRIMGAILVRSAREIFVSTPKWNEFIYQLAGREVKTTWLPVPSNVPVVEESDKERHDLRRRYVSEQGLLIGHFGTYGVAIAEPLAATIAALLAQAREASMVLAGRNSESFRSQLVARYPELAERIHATGGIDAAMVSRNAQTWDLMIQPYPDGITTRRGSVMMGLSHGVAVVSNAGTSTEALWGETGAVALAANCRGDDLLSAAITLVKNKAARDRFGSAGRQLYLDRFALRHTIAGLREHPRH